MKVRMENEIYTIFLEGRIDSSNAPATEQELLELTGKSGENKLVIDAGNLDYISSAGLRVLLKLQKTRTEKLCVQNVKPEIYEIFETTGFTEMLNIQKALREIDIENSPVIGQGGNGTIYRIDEDTIVKVYKPWMSFEQIQRERDYAQTAFVNGIPSVIAYDVVKCGDCFGLVFEMLKSDTLGHAMHNQPEKFEEYVDKYVALAKTLHSTHVPAGKFSRVQDVYHRFADNLSKWCTPE
jgi:anti-anti-sigma factor